MIETCLSCKIVHGQQETLGGTLTETKFFHAHQDSTYPIPGLMIVAAKRHFIYLDELSDEEAQDFIALTINIRKAQRKVLDTDYIYYFYNEDTTHHFHLWMVPRYKWMAQFGRSVQAIRPALRHAKEHMNSAKELEQAKQTVNLLTRVSSEKEFDVMERIKKIGH